MSPEVAYLILVVSTAVGAVVYAVTRLVRTVQNHRLAVQILEKEGSAGLRHLVPLVKAQQQGEPPGAAVAPSSCLTAARAEAGWRMYPE